MLNGIWTKSAVAAPALPAHWFKVWDSKGMVAGWCLRCRCPALTGRRKYGVDVTRASSPGYNITGLQPEAWLADGKSDLGRLSLEHYLAARKVAQTSKSVG